MFKIVFAFAAISAVVLAEPDVPEAANRFLAVTRTSTSIVLSTTTIPTTVVRTCYTTNAAPSACRRRRGLEEQPFILDNGKVVESDFIQPTQAQFVEATAAPAAPAIHDETEILSSASDDVTALDNSLARAAFGITIYYTTTSTLVLSTYSTSTSGSTTFTISGCVPLGLTYTTC